MNATVHAQRVSFPTIHQFGGRMQALLSLAQASRATFEGAIEQAMVVHSFYGVPRSVIGVLPKIFGPEVESFAKTMFGALQRPLVQSMTALADYPAPSRLRAEAADDELIIACAKHEIIPENSARALIGAASLFESMMDVSSDNALATLNARLEVALKVWKGDMQSQVHHDNADNLLMNYEVPQLKWLGESTDSGELKRSRFLRALKNAVETDMLRAVIGDITRKRTVLRGVQQGMLRDLRSSGVLSRETHAVIKGVVGQPRGSLSERPTIRVKHGNVSADTQMSQVEAGAIYRMNLAMKIWAGNVELSDYDQKMANAMLTEYELPVLSKINQLIGRNKRNRLYFIDMFRRSVETDVLREVVSNMGVLQFVEPQIFDAMRDIGIITLPTYLSISAAIEMQTKGVHERPTVEVDITPLLEE